ncbi:MAG: T9SS type A sorting domain-containing protein [Bacteroidetes bacterium]|nr:T9SS type A sorting domain-containing protein [Bacteroidota bacterium]
MDIYDNSTGLWTTANLSQARSALSSTAVGTKVFFAGGMIGSSSYSSVVDIYDNSTGLWTTANLSQARSVLSATAVGTKVFFAGGFATVPQTVFSVVDIYDNSTGLWSTANLSVARGFLSAATVGSKVFFAGGFTSNGTGYSSVVDIYDNSTGLWTTDSLSVARGYLSATSVGTKVFFAGGRNPGFSSVVDIYDNTIADINVINNNEGIEIYPNPAINQFTIDNDPDLIGMKIESVAIYDVSGRKVYSENLGTANSNPKITIDVSKFSAGVYQVKVQSADFIATKKLVVEK